MDIRKLQRAIVDGLEDVKAQNIVVFNTEALSPLFERVIIASGTSNRQTKALASSVRETVKERGLQVLRTEGEDNGEWIIVDCGAAVAHIMQPAIRDYYHLEEIWGAKPVKLKSAAGTAAKAAAEAIRKAARPSTAAPAAGGARAPAGKAANAAKPAAQAAAKAGAKKRPTAGAKTVAPRSGGARPSAAKPAGAKRTGGRPAAKAPARPRSRQG